VLKLDAYGGGGRKGGKKGRTKNKNEFPVSENIFPKNRRKSRALWCLMNLQRCYIARVKPREERIHFD